MSTDSSFVPSCKRSLTSNLYLLNMFSVEPIEFPFKEMSLTVSTPKIG